MRRWAPIAIALLISACAEIAPPPGGPIDETPVALVGVSPESLATRVDPLAPLRWEFSERVDRRAFLRNVSIVPVVELSGPHFDGLDVRMEPVEGWPADTVVVWTLLEGLRDKHGATTKRARSGAFTTGDSFPRGEIRGQVSGLEAKDDPMLVRAVLSLPPEEDARRGLIWRQTNSDANGSFALLWLDVPSGPYDLSVFLDRNSNGNRDEREPISELDSLYLAGPDSIFVLGPEKLVLIDREAPVAVMICASTGPTDSTALVVVAHSDELGQPVSSKLFPDSCVSLQLAPGNYAIGAWADHDGDDRWGPDSLGVSEPFVGPLDLEIFPARPESLSIRWPAATLPWAEVDTARVLPVPRALHSALSPSER